MVEKATGESKPKLTREAMLVAKLAKFDAGTLSRRVWAGCLRFLCFRVRCKHTIGAKNG